jgi:hypothetical protein
MLPKYSTIAIAAANDKYVIATLYMKGRGWIIAD